VQEVFTHGAGCFELETGDRRQRVLADETDDLLEFGLFLQQAHGVSPEAAPFWCDGLVHPVVDFVSVQRVAVEPVDRGKWRL
jgi:hypothetical protein